MSSNGKERRRRQHINRIDNCKARGVGLQFATVFLSCKSSTSINSQKKELFIARNIGNKRRRGERKRIIDRKSVKTAITDMFKVLKLVQKKQLSVKRVMNEEMKRER